MPGICTAPVYKLKELNNLFIELTAKNCNQRCNCCYIKFPFSKNVKDFISTDIIKKALADTKNENLECIYLTGAEPMTHPDFNAILRLCLKRCNVCICTNGSFLNEKKIRFLKKVEEEGDTQIFFRLSLTHYIELENDKAKYRGNYRQTMFALKNLSYYNFLSVLVIQNFYNLDKINIMKNFEEKFNEYQIFNTDIQIKNSYPNLQKNNEINTSEQTDCMYGRTLTSNGIYSCPFLAGDYRGRVGSSFKDYSTSINAESDFCMFCSQCNNFIFSLS